MIILQTFVATLLLVKHHFCFQNKIPPNNHGIEPLVLIGDQEEELVKNRVLTVIPRLSPEWSVSFTLRLISLTYSSSYCNIIHLTKGGEWRQHGDKTPAVYLNPSKDKFQFVSSINNSPNHAINLANGLALNVSTRIEIHQRYTSGGKYRYFIKINGEEVSTVINTYAQQFYNVKVYASNPWETTCSGYIKNFEVTNFL